MSRTKPITLVDENGNHVQQARVFYDDDGVAFVQVKSRAWWSFGFRVWRTITIQPEFEKMSTVSLDKLKDPS